MNQEEREARDRGLQGELKLAFEDYLLATGSGKDRSQTALPGKVGPVRRSGDESQQSCKFHK